MTEMDWRPPGYLPPARHGALRDVVQAGTHFRIEGDGPAVVLVHGVGLDLAMWDAVAAELSDGHTVIRYDMLGHGHSAKPPGSLTLGAFANQLEDLAAYLKLGRFALVGFSRGAMVAQEYALAQPHRVIGVALLTGVHERGEAEREAVRARLEQATRDGPAAVVDAALDRWFSQSYRDANPTTVDAVRRRLEGNDRQSFLAAYRVFADSAPSRPVREISCPTLVATGENDRGSTPAMTETLAAEIPGAEAHVLPGLAHMAPVEGADIVAELLRTFLIRLRDTA